jgi:hypothetical protein
LPLRGNLFSFVFGGLGFVVVALWLFSAGCDLPTAERCADKLDKRAGATC